MGLAESCAFSAEGLCSSLLPAFSLWRASTSGQHCPVIFIACQCSTFLHDFKWVSYTCSEFSLARLELGDKKGIVMIENNFFMCSRESLLPVVVEQQRRPSLQQSASHISLRQKKSVLPCDIMRVAFPLPRRIGGRDKDDLTSSSTGKDLVCKRMRNLTFGLSLSSLAASACTKV